MDRRNERADSGNGAPSPGILPGFLGIGPDSWDFGEIPGTLRRLNGTLRRLHGTLGWLNGTLRRLNGTLVWLNGSCAG